MKAASSTRTRAERKRALAPPTTRPSSVDDAIQFEIGSGDRLIIARVPAFAHVRGTGERAAGGDREHGRIGMAERAGREHGAGRNADEGVHGIPQRIERGDLVGKEFGDGEHGRGADDPRRHQDGQRVGRVEPAEPRQRAGDPARSGTGAGRSPRGTAPSEMASIMASPHFPCDLPIDRIGSDRLAARRGDRHHVLRSTTVFRPECVPL